MHFLYLRLYYCHFFIIYFYFAPSASSVTLPKRMWCGAEGYSRVCL